MHADVAAIEILHHPKQSLAWFAAPLSGGFQGATVARSQISIELSRPVYTYRDGKLSGASASQGVTAPPRTTMRQCPR